jgi:hypothetical protein
MNKTFLVGFKNILLLNYYLESLHFNNFRSLFQEYAEVSTHTTNTK